MLFQVITRDESDSYELRPLWDHVSLPNNSEFCKIILVYSSPYAPLVVHAYLFRLCKGCFAVSQLKSAFVPHHSIFYFILTHLDCIASMDQCLKIKFNRFAANLKPCLKWIRISLKPLFKSHCFEAIVLFTINSGKFNSLQLMSLLFSKWQHRSFHPNFHSEEVKISIKWSQELMYHDIVNTWLTLDWLTFVLNN